MAEKKKKETEEEKAIREKTYLDAFQKLYNMPEQEKEAKYLGIVLTNAIDRKNPSFSNCLTYEQFLEKGVDSDVILAGYITDMNLTKSKKGKMYGLIQMSDELYNDFEIMTNEKCYLEIEKKVEKGNLVILRGKKLDSLKISLNKDNLYKVDIL